MTGTDIKPEVQPDTKPRPGYAVTFTAHPLGRVDVYHWPHAVEGMPGWRKTQDEARHAAAEQMRHLSNELLRAAYELTINKHRGR